MNQLALFDQSDGNSVEIKEWGTFKDSLRAPVHSWFTYPAGFSYKAVIASIKTHCVSTSQIIYDPFMGTGTTNLTAKTLGLSSYGVEAHPFVFHIARTKLNWNIDSNDVIKSLKEVDSYLLDSREQSDNNIKQKIATEFPELILKCYEQTTLYELMLIRNAVSNLNLSPEIYDLFFVGLTNVLREISTAATGWPYIAPKKQKTASFNKNAQREFSNQIFKMMRDIWEIKNMLGRNNLDSFHHIYNADSRDTSNLIQPESVHHIFTSPPYLNNFDYADRTRLELYFWKEATTWGEITNNIRTKLITSATTQISRNDMRYDLCDDLNKSSPEVYDFLNRSVEKLAKIRLTKGGKKNYDLLVGGYFNDMFQVISDVYRVLKNNSKAVFVLGDSAPYGVHIPTDELIGKIGKGVGFSNYHIDILRERGGKWKNNPQRHCVPLRESIVTLIKK